MAPNGVFSLDKIPLAVSAVLAGKAVEKELGVAKETFFRWMHTNKELGEAVRAARISRLSMLEGKEVGDQMRRDAQQWLLYHIATQGEVTEETITESDVVEGVGTTRTIKVIRGRPPDMRLLMKIIDMSAADKFLVEINVANPKSLPPS